MIVYTLAELRNGTGFARGAQFVPMEDVEALRQALRACVTAGALIQAGERGGYTMGAVSSATDAARLALGDVP